jgi:hypothetical protein
MANTFFFILLIILCVQNLKLPKELAPTKAWCILPAVRVLETSPKAQASDLEGIFARY